jgi:hypothetical protein
MTAFIFTKISSSWDICVLEGVEADFGIHFIIA